MNEAGTATAREGSPARSRVRRAGPLLVAFGHLGYVVEGLVFVLVGALAVRVALGRGGAATDSRGALLPIAAAPLGRLLLLAIAVGFVGYALWRFLEAAFDPDGRGCDTNRIAMRLGNAINGALHLGFACSVARLLRTGGAGANTDAAKGWTAALLGQPGGRWLVGLLGLGVLGFAAAGVLAMRGIALCPPSCGGVRATRGHHTIGTPEAVAGRVRGESGRRAGISGRRTRCRSSRPRAAASPAARRARRSPR